ncbi:MAG: hypothetical protein K2X71_12900 [Methylobacterium sp.]|uniref:hypothetical protein n=1 Tax=Methylobacterium sp. TaxID=409 RepID=UPI00258544B8|nr:hypothetical protein [Methylobacterium sp.]MBY0296914.1 hypothetical protein [Methylobacterium sp.]
MRAVLVRSTLVAAVLTGWTGTAGAQSFELDKRLRDCLREQAHKHQGAASPRGDLKQVAGQLLGSCADDARAWMRVCRTWGSETDCARATDVRAVGALQDGAGHAKGH